jgi:hypothetical protein
LPYDGLVPRKDTYHDVVRQALERDGWLITDDPLSFKIETDQIFIDLGAERMIAASKGVLKIAVEIKTFAGPSPLHDLQAALGQYVIYKRFLAELEPDRVLVLAVPTQTAKLFQRPMWWKLITHENIKLLVYHPYKAEVVQWLPQP